MSIKGKLIAGLSIITMILTLLAAVVIWNTAKIHRQLKLFSPTIDYLHDIRRMRSDFYRQSHALAYFLIFGKEGNRADLNKLSAEIKEYLKKIEKKAKTRVGSGARGAEKAVNKLEEVGKIYNAFLNSVDSVLRLDGSGKREEAVLLIKKETDLLMDDVLLRKIDGMLIDEVENLDAMYHEVFMRLGLMPWVYEKSFDRTAIAETALHYFLSVDRADLIVSRQMKKLMDYLVTGNGSNMTMFEEYGVDVKKAFEEVDGIAQVQRELALKDEKSGQTSIRAVKQRYADVLESVEKILALRKRGKAEEAFGLMERDLKFLIGGALLTTIDGVMYESKEEIADAHRALLQATISAGLQGLIVLALVLAGIFIVFFRLIGGMVVSLVRLKEGTEIIGRGDLDHRIATPFKDELGELASSFNKMTDAVKESNEELKHFAYIVSHDLRAPLVNIKGFAAELRRSLEEIGSQVNSGAPRGEATDAKGLDSILRRDVPEALGFIDSSVTRMDGLITAILKLSRIGRRELTPEPLDPEGLVRSLLKTLAHQLEERKVTVTVGPLPRIVADKTALEQIMGNLLDNAVKYLEPGREGILEITAEQGPAETTFHIRDNGRGIAKDDMPKVFEIFRRLGRQDVPGEGMGLASVKTLVRRHGGRIWCRSDPGKGSIFSFTIPRFDGNTKKTTRT